MANRMKNVIVIMADSWRFDYLGCYGNDWIQTPNIDSFTKESTLFENAYAEGCPTIPTRRALLTGRYTLPYSGWRPLATADQTLADFFWTERIQTAFISDTSMMHMPGYGYERGFDFVQHIRGHQWDRFFRPLSHDLDMDRFHKKVLIRDSDEGEIEIPVSLWAKSELNDYLPFRQHWKTDEDQMSARVSRAAMNYLDRVNREAPFFLWVDCFDPHEQWDPPSIWDPEMKCPYDLDYEGVELINPAGTIVDGYLTEREAHHVRMLYAEKVTTVDKWLGKILDKLKNLGLYDDSLIIFLSDHGEPLGNGEHGHGLMRKCRPWPYEELVHIPLVIHHPGHEGNRISSYVQTVDIAPTIVDFLEMPDVSDLMQGKSLLPLIKGDVDKVRDFAIAGYFNLSWSIITDDWSYIHWLDPKDPHPIQMLSVLGLAKMEEHTEIWTCVPGSAAETPETDELYDRQKDTYQLKNLLEQKPDVANDMFLKLRDFMLGLRSEPEQQPRKQFQVIIPA